MVSCNLQEYLRVHRNQGRQDKSADLGLRMQHRSKVVDSTARMSETHKKTIVSGQVQGPCCCRAQRPEQLGKKRPPA